MYRCCARRLKFCWTGGANVDMAAGVTILILLVSILFFVHLERKNRQRMKAFVKAVELIAEQARAIEENTTERLNAISKKIDSGGIVPYAERVEVDLIVDEVIKWDYFVSRRDYEKMTLQWADLEVRSAEIFRAWKRVPKKLANEEEGRLYYPARKRIRDYGYAN